MSDLTLTDRTTLAALCLERRLEYLRDLRLGRILERDRHSVRADAERLAVIAHKLTGKVAA